MRAVRSFFSVSPDEWEWRIGLLPLLLILWLYAPLCIVLVAVVLSVLAGLVAYTVAAVVHGKPAAPICPDSQNMRTMKPPEAQTSGGP